jgi:FHS family L-fucose permease-like MFS transporter
VFPHPPRLTNRRFSEKLAFRVDCRIPKQSHYFIQPDIGGLTPKVAATYVSLYWFGSMAGRFLGSAVMRKIPASIVVGVFALIVLGLLTTSILCYGKAAMWSVLFVGCFNSIMFPSIFTLGIANLGSLTSKGSGILMSAAVGGAVVPVAQGALADRIGVHHAFILSALCYLYVAFYGFRGWKPAGPAMNAGADNSAAVASLPAA